MPKDVVSNDLVSSNSLLYALIFGSNIHKGRMFLNIFVLIKYLKY